MSTRDECFRKYIDSLHLMNDETISIDTKFTVFCQICGEDAMLEILKQQLKRNYRRYQDMNNFDVVNFHDTLRPAKTNQITSANKSNLEMSQKQSSFTYRGLRVKEILCGILSYLDIGSFVTAIMVNRQWFHDSFDCTFDTLNLNDCTTIDSRYLSHYLKRYYKCTSIIASKFIYDSVLKLIMKHWTNFAQLKSIWINFNSVESSTALRMFHYIAAKSDDIEYLRISKKSKEYSKIKDEDIDEQFNQCQFNNLTKLHLHRMMPILYIYSQKLQYLNLDIWDTQMENFKVFLEQFYLNTHNGEDKYESLQHRLQLGLKQFELCVSRKGRSRRRRSHTMDTSGDEQVDTDNELVMQANLLSNFAYLLQNVEKLKIHCPFVNIFKLLSLVSQKADKYINSSISDNNDDSITKSNNNLAPKLEELDIRLESIDNTIQRNEPIIDNDSGTESIDTAALVKNPFKNLENLTKVTMRIDDDWDIENKDNIGNINNLLLNVKMINFIGKERSYKNSYRYHYNKRILLQIVCHLLQCNLQYSSTNCLQCIKVQPESRCSLDEKISLSILMNLLTIFKQLIDKRVNPIPMYFEIQANVEKTMTFSELNNDIPKFIEILKYIVERSWVNFSIKFSYNTPKGTFDSFNQPMLKSLNVIRRSHSSVVTNNDNVNVYVVPCASKAVVCKMGTSFVVRNGSS